MYFNDCATYQFKDKTTGDICDYRHGQVQAMVLPIVLSLGEWTAAKVTGLAAAEYVANAEKAVKLISDAETASKIIDDIEVIGKGAGDVPAIVIEEDSKNATTIYKNDETATIETKEGYLHAEEADLTALKQVTSNVTSNGRSITGVNNLVNVDNTLIKVPQALIIVPQDATATTATALKQTVADYMKTQATGSTATTAEMGEKLEDVAEQLAKEINPTGTTVNMKTNGSGNGFDIISVKYGTDGTTVEKIYIFESKPLTNGTRIDLPTTVSKGVQMSDQWIRGTIQEMQNATGSVETMGNLLNANYSKIERYITTVDRRLKQVVTVKLDNF